MQDHDGTSINGTFTQNGKPIPLDLIRGEYKIEPKEYLKKVKCPVLALNGEKDFQVLAEVNLEGIKNALGISNNTDFTTEELKDLNHLFQTSVTDSFNEYASNEESFSPIALEIISKWINERFANKK